MLTISDYLIVSHCIVHTSYHLIDRPQRGDSQKASTTEQQTKYIPDAFTLERDLLMVIDI